MKLAARIFLLFTGLLLLAHYLPAGYWLVAGQRQRVPTVFYSAVQKGFLLFRSDKGTLTRTDPAGKIYEREEFEQLLPLDNYMQLYKDGRMPKEIDGVAITPEKLRRERVNVRLKPEALDSPSVALLPLFESESGRVRLEMPSDFMRLGDRIEFIDAKSNRLLAEKTAQFQRVFSDAGFAFPVRVIGGNPSTLKPYDEGYFLVDAQDNCFRLRQVHGAPELSRLVDLAAPGEKSKWSGLRPRFIHVQEQDNREIHAVIIGRNNAVYLAVDKDFRLVALPLQRFDPDTMQLMLRGDLLNRLAAVNSSGYVEAVVMNRNYEFLDRYTETLSARAERPAGRIAAALFPFTLELESATSGFLGFHFAPGDVIAFGLNLVLVAGSAGWWVYRKRPLRGRWPELAAVGVGGIFGLVLVSLLPKTE
jgi:hypothetical protein